MVGKGGINTEPSEGLGPSSLARANPRGFGAGRKEPPRWDGNHPGGIPAGPGGTAVD